MPTIYKMVTAPSEAFEPQVGWVFKKLRTTKQGDIKLRLEETADGTDASNMIFEIEVPPAQLHRHFREILPPIDISKLTREDLIQICHDAVVLEEHWANRDSQRSQVKVGEAWALLRAGCKFWFDEQMMLEDQRRQTIWIRIQSKSFNYFELGDENYEVELFYLPTPERLRKTHGKDWY